MITVGEIDFVSFTPLKINGSIEQCHRHSMLTQRRQKIAIVKKNVTH